jgi:hypothetical protein
MESLNPYPAQKKLLKIDLGGEIIKLVSPILFLFFVERSDLYR